MRRVWTEQVAGREVTFDVADAEERPRCPPEDRCCVCDWIYRKGPQPYPGQRVAPNHGKAS